MTLRAAQFVPDAASPGPDAEVILKHWADLTADYLAKVIARASGAPARLVESVHYSVLAGGKRLRPALVLECNRACSSAHGQASSTASALAAAGAVELIHTFSLVHDDLPAMDDDDLRRGRPTNHKVFGEAMAILAGDAMVSMAFELIATDAAPPHVAPLVCELAQATGPEGMIGGQALDIDPHDRPTSLEQLQHLHRMKTGALLRSACRLGAIAADAPQSQRSAIDAFGHHLGLVFQIVDDILDVTSTPEQMGKATHKDAAKGKTTYPMLLGLDASRREAADHLSRALDAIAPLGPAAAGLAGMARFVVSRSH